VAGNLTPLLFGKRGSSYREAANGDNFNGSSDLARDNCFRMSDFFGIDESTKGWLAVWTLLHVRFDCFCRFTSHGRFYSAASYGDSSHPSVLPMPIPNPLIGPFSFQNYIVVTLLFPFLDVVVSEHPSPWNYAPPTENT
jgi:hypothetical protein